MHKLLLGSCLLAAALPLAAQSPLTTTFANNNSGSVGGGVYFDLTVNVPVNITSIDVNLNSATSTSGVIDIYTCPGTYSGNEAIPSNWTLIGSGNVVSNGPGGPSTITLAAPIPLVPGTAGYAYAATGLAFAYTNGNGSNQTYSTTELTLNAGSATNVAFAGSPFSPRVVNTSIYYATGGSGYAAKTPFGEGCYEAPRMVYEKIPANTIPIDLVNTQQLMIYTPSPMGGSYIIVQGAAPYDPVTAAANGVDLVTQPYTSSYSTGGWDDASVVKPLPATTFPAGFPFPGPGGGSTTEITINSNGKIYLGNTVDASFASVGSNYNSTAPFQGTTGAGLPVLSPFNVDLDPVAAGHIWYEDPSPGGGVRITWDGIPNWQDTAGPPAVICDFQMELLPSGQVVFAYGPSLGNGGSADNAVIVGFSAGNSEPLSDPVDWSTLSGYVSGNGAVPMLLSADARPVIGTTVNLTTDNIPTGSILSALVYGLTKFDPGINLSTVGMPDCFQYCSQEAVLLTLSPATSSVTNPFVIPNAPALSGVFVIAQGAAFDPAGGHNQRGALSTNGIELGLDIN